MRIAFAKVVLHAVSISVAIVQQGTAELPLPKGTQVEDPIAVPVSFSFTPHIPGEAAWSIEVLPDRTGTYREQAENGPHQPITVSEAVWKRLSAGNTTVRGGHCETKLKGIAQTGTKTISFVLGPSAPVSCTFNYSDDERLNDAASAFLAVAETIREGAKLQRDHRFDKLALDTDIETLVSEVAAGRALEPGNIASVLRSLAEDERVIDRVRRKAARLLQDAGVDAPALPDKPR